MDWVFDEEMKLTYDNPVYLEQKKKRNETVDVSGFVVPKKLSEIEEESKAKNTEDEKPKVEDFFDDDDEDDEDDELPMELQKPKKPEIKKPERPNRPEKPNKLEETKPEIKQEIKQPIKQEIKEENNPKNIFNNSNNNSINNSIDSQNIVEKPKLKFKEYNGNNNTTQKQKFNIKPKNQ